MLNFLLHHTPFFYLTQSLWRDEAFSVWIASGTLADVFTRTSGDFNPPLYYLLLNLWMKIFGSSEVAARSLSVVFFCLFLFTVYHFGKAIFKNTQSAWITTIIAALNPMLLYFAFELRMYSLLTLWAASATYFLYKKSWVWYILTAAAGMYTQPFMAFVLLSHGFYMLLTKQFKTALWVFPSIGLLFLPWVPTVLEQLRHSGPMWMYPIDNNLVFSVLGNIFMGYEGTPDGLWTYMKILSVLMLGISILVWREKKLRPAVLLLYCVTFVPLILVLGISLIKPIYVHRYVIFVAVGEVLLLSLFLHSLKGNVQKTLTVGLVLILLWANVFATSFHHKVDFRNTFYKLSREASTTDFVYANNPLSYYESWYYVSERWGSMRDGEFFAYQPARPVYLYNPDQLTPPRFVGAVGIPESVWAKDFPPAPQRVFMVFENGTYTIQ